MLAFATSPAVDAVMLEARAADFSKRSLKREAKRAAIDLAIRCIDLTTLEGKDSPGKVESLCAKAALSRPRRAFRRRRLRVSEHGRGRQARAGRHRREGRLGRDRVSERPLVARREAARYRGGVSGDGADEIDMVINRGAFLAGDEQSRLR